MAALIPCAGSGEAEPVAPVTGRGMIETLKTKTLV